jgi:hypothetical protein
LYIHGAASGRVDMQQQRARVSELLVSDRAVSRVQAFHDSQITVTVHCGTSRDKLAVDNFISVEKTISIILTRECFCLFSAEENSF